MCKTLGEIRPEVCRQPKNLQCASYSHENVELQRQAVVSGGPTALKVDWQLKEATQDISSAKPQVQKLICWRLSSKVYVQNVMEK